MRHVNLSVPQPLLSSRSRALAIILLLSFVAGPFSQSATRAHTQVRPYKIVTTGAQGSGARGNAQSKKSSSVAAQRISHVLNRLTFGARPGDFERVKAMGVDAFIAQQLDPDSLDDSALDPKLKKFPTLALAQTVLIEQYTPPKPVVSPSTVAPPSPQASPAITPAEPKAVVVAALDAKDKTEAMMQMEKPESKSASMGQNTGAPEVKKIDDAGQAAAKPSAPKPPEKNAQRVVTELQRAALLRAVYSERQLYEGLVQFWENHFSIYIYKDEDRYLLTSFDRDTVRPFAMGRFRDLLGATAHSPAMLFYLDNWRSSVPRPYPATKDKPAGVDGGLNENYARELMELHTLGVDGGYTQKDVQEVARCFTGWTIQKPNEEGLFLYRPGLHDNGEKIVLGHKIPAGGGIADGERVLDILATQPATARFIATKLARRFIADDPPASVINRAAATFLKTDGSIRETLRTIITSPEFFSPAAYRAKVRTPFEYLVAALRALNVETDIDPAVPDWTKRMGQQVFGRATPDGYPDRAEQWLSAGAMLERFNFANALASNKIKGTRFDLARAFKDDDMNDPQVVAARLSNALLANDMSQPTRAALAKFSNGGSTLCAPDVNVKSVNYPTEQSQNKKAANACGAEIVEVITMLIGSPEFQRR